MLNIAVPIRSEVKVDNSNSSNTSKPTNNNINSNVSSTVNTNMNKNIISTSGGEVKDDKLVVETPKTTNPIKTVEPKQDFKALMMQRMSNMGVAKGTPEVKEETKPVVVINNLPEKDPNTGKIIIDVPVGTKDSERMDINSMINKANKIKEEQEKKNAKEGKVEKVS